MSDLLSMLGSIVHSQATESSNALALGLGLLLIARWTYALRVPSSSRKAARSMRGPRRAGSEIAREHLATAAGAKRRAPAARGDEAAVVPTASVPASATASALEHVTAATGVAGAPSVEPQLLSAPGTGGAPGRGDDGLGERAIACYS